tara:strand:+ start:201 stop:503 length:303 start_codon:yes stop_codon:yes gene_type:complete
MTQVKTEESNIKTITDPVLEPYYIAMDEYNYTVQEVVTPNPKYSETGKPYTKPVGHYSKFTACIATIAKRKVNTRSYTSLKEYLEEYKRVINELNKTFEI